MFTEMSSVLPGCVALSGLESGAPICSPLVNTSVYLSVQAQVPVFFTRHVLTNVSLVSRLVLSGTVTSDTKAALSVHPDELALAVGAAEDVGAAGEVRFASDVDTGRVAGFSSGVDVPPAAQAESASVSRTTRESVLCIMVQPP